MQIQVLLDILCIPSPFSTNCMSVFDIRYNAEEHSEKPAIYEQVMPLDQTCRVTQVVGQLLNLPDVGRPLVSFRMCEDYPHNLLMFCRSLVSFRLLQIVWIFSVSNLPTSHRSLVSLTTCLMLAGHWSVFGCVGNYEISGKLLTQPKTDQWPANIRQVF